MWQEEHWDLRGDFLFLPESWPPPPPPVPQRPPRRRSSKRPSSASLLLSGSEQSSPRPGPVRSGALLPPAAEAAAWAQVPASPVWSPPTMGPRCLIPRSARWANCRLQPTNPMAFCTGPQAATENKQAQQGPPASRACFLPFYILHLFSLNFSTLSYIYIFLNISNEINFNTELKNVNHVFF